ncbi:MAG: DUF4123 domain-containing protein [Rhodobacteraceae bacterium]|nr:DUF4123 domain-containing protein [Paracoccaceae bacterium]
MMDLPPSIAPPPEKEAMLLALDQLVFEALEKDAVRRAENPGGDKGPLMAYLLVDASCDPLITMHADSFNEQSRCLFDGQAFEDLAEVALWLISLERNGQAWDWFMDEGWSNNWGIVILSRLPLAKLKSHFKKFIEAEDEDGEVCFFKFYRPEHLNTYLPVFDDEQRAHFLKGIDGILTEVGDGLTALVHRLGKDAQLETVSVDLVTMGEPLIAKAPTDEEVEAYVNQVLQAQA